MSFYKSPFNLLLYDVDRVSPIAYRVSRMAYCVTEYAIGNS